jgi:hypothetical protein
MTRRYLAVGNWVDKETGVVKSSLAEISEGIGKETKTQYQLMKDGRDFRVIIEDYIPLGTIVSTTMAFDIPAAATPAPDKPDKTK